MSVYDGKFDLPDPIKRGARTWFQSFVTLLGAAIVLGHWTDKVPPLADLVDIIKLAAWMAGVSLLPGVGSILHNAGEEAGKIPPVLK